MNDAIEKESARTVRDLLLLAWSASVAKLNKTFLSAKGRAASRGGSSIFSIYRYKIASSFVELPIWQTFEGRFRNVLDAKEEVLQIVRYREQLNPRGGALDSARNFQVMACDAATLDHQIKPGTVDYIFTDPPYGGFISYLDLSVLWNHWLGFPITEEIAQNEIIVGGERELSESHYKARLAESVRTSLRLLRADRWMSIVFQHWDVGYFEAILLTAEQSGAELRTAITQTGDVIWSMHKKKNSSSVLAGELILTFYKPPKTRRRNTRSDAAPVNSALVLSEVLDDLLSNETKTFSSEALFNRLVIEFWHRRALSCLTLDRRAFAENLESRGWDYDSKAHLWSHRRHAPRAPAAASLFEQ